MRVVNWLMKYGVEHVSFPPRTKRLGNWNTTQDELFVQTGDPHIVDQIIEVSVFEPDKCGYSIRCWP